MTTESSQNQDFTRKHPSEGMDALEKEAKLPLNGWENEVARAKESVSYTHLTLPTSR